MEQFGIREYVDAVDELVSKIENRSDLVAAIMPLKKRLLQTKNLIPQSFLIEKEGIPYTRNLLHADPDGRFVVMALVWKAGATTLPHDHKSWGVVGTYTNSMSVVNYSEPKDTGQSLKACGEGKLDAGCVVGVRPPRLRNLHTMTNHTNSPSVTIHTYGDPADSCRTYCPETSSQVDVSLTFHEKLPC